MSDISIWEWLFLGMPWELVVVFLIVLIPAMIYGTVHMKMQERAARREAERQKGPKRPTGPANLSPKYRRGSDHPSL